MSEEEKKAIKVLKVNPKIIAELDKDLLYKMFEFEGQSIEELKDWSYEIVLNLIEKQQKEISELKSKYDKDTHTLQNQLDVANADRIEKDKIINEMAEHIVSSAIVDDTVCAIKCDCDINEDCSYEKMLKCTKQYFEKKVREEYEKNNSI